MSKQSKQTKGQPAPEKPVADMTAAELRLSVFNSWWAAYGDTQGDNKAVERVAWFAGYEYGRQGQPGGKPGASVDSVKVEWLTRIKPG